MSKCKCCALNEEEFPKVLCRNEPYGEEIDPITACKDFLTEEYNETFMSCFYKTIDGEQWGKLDYPARNRLKREIRELCQI